MYTDVITSMDGARTLKEHITKLQAILDLPPVDPQLASCLRVVICVSSDLIWHCYSAELKLD